MRRVDVPTPGPHVQGTSFRSRWLRAPRFARVAPPVAAFTIVLTAWLAAVNFLKTPAYLLPAPGALLEELSNVDLYVRHGSVTIIEATAGFGIATVIGVSLAVLIDRSVLLERALTPYLIVATNIPIVAFAPIVILYFGFGMESKIVVAAFVTFFPIVIYTSKGLKSADPVLRDLFYSNSASWWQTLRHLEFPAALPFIFAALKIAATASVLAAVVAEFIQAAQGLGWLILTAAYVSNMTRVWATVIVSSAMAIVFYSLVTLVERRVIPWHASMRGQPG
jgi:NitT/TauT family transport system permease protein